ncbi:MAG: hypothetical protein AAF512_06245, partial [Pseudomonadota bacterium]
FLLAFAIGSLFGWFLKRVYTREELAETTAEKNQLQHELLGAQRLNSHLEQELDKAKSVEPVVDNSAELDALQQDINGLEEKLKVSEARCKALEQEIAEEKAKLVATTPPTSIEPPAAEPGSPEPESMTFFESAPEETDDLQAIAGVGKVLAQKLNDLGIYQYQQIAKFTPEDITKVDSSLRFKGRVERDNWIEQAKALHRDKYGSEPM